MVNFYQTTNGVEDAIVNYLNYRRHIIINNLYYGMFSYELDICALDKNSFYAKEIEIKISKADLKRDLQKKHHHQNKYIKYLYFAMPKSMSDCVDLVPDYAGIYLVDSNGNVIVFRKAKENPVALKWPIEKAFELGRLGTIRYWNTLKRMRECFSEIRHLKAQCDVLKRTIENMENEHEAK